MGDERHGFGLRPLLHYLVTYTLIGIYGIQVCPFIESLTVAQVAVPLLVTGVVLFALRGRLYRTDVLATPYKGQVRRTFLLDWALMIAAGLVITLYNTRLYEFPVLSGLKVVLGFATLGFFSACDLALARERRLAGLFAARGIHLEPDPDYFPMVRKFALFAVVAIGFSVGIHFLVVNKDLDWLVEVGGEVPLAEARLAVLGEFAFVAAVLLGYMLKVIYAYAANLRGFFDNENRVLGAATAGDLHGSVPVASNDELGVMAHRTNVMIAELCRRTEELQRTQDVTIHSLASLAEARDNETGAHILRTQRYVRALAEALRDVPDYREYLDEPTIDLLFKSAPLHDIGKVGIPDRILLKPGRLDPDEFEVMKTHATIGGDALAVAERELGGSSFLQLAKEIAMTHHEKWDGSGYPGGLAGEAIPIAGRLMAVADVYDALISKRVYKEAFSHDTAMGIIREGRGAHFDPQVVDALERVEDEFVAIARRYADEGHPTGG